MYILSIKQKELIEQLAELDAQGVNYAFSFSEALGLTYLSNSITEYTNLLIKKHGNIVLSYSSEYRTYIIELLKKVDDEYKKDVLSELVNPKLKRITNEELFEILNNTFKKEQIKLEDDKPNNISIKKEI